MKYLFTAKDLRKLIIPLIIEQFLQCFVGLADSIMVASVGEAAVSGVSLVDTVMILLINIFAALATGGAVVAGQYLGKRNKEMGCQVTNQLIIFTAIVSIVVMALGYIGKNFILHGVFGSIEADVMRDSNLYMLIVFASIPFIALYNSGAAIFRSMGDSKTPMLVSVLMNGINLGGNAVLIYGFHRGVEGVAVPTLVSRMAACFVMLALLANQKRLLHYSTPFRIKFDNRILKKILYIGIPNSLENSMFQLGKIFVLSMVASFGTASIAANAVANNVAMFAILPGMAIGFALLTVASRCVGAGDHEQLRYYTKKLMIISYIALFFVNIVVILLIPWLIRLYNLSSEASNYAQKILIYHSVCLLFIWPISFVLPNTLRAANDVKYTMVLSIISMWAFRIGFSYLLGKIWGWGVFGVWVAMTIDWLFRSIFFLIHYLRGKWKNKYQIC